MRDVAERQAIAQAFVEDVRLLDNPGGDLGVVNARAEERFVVGKPDVPVDGAGHFQEFQVEVRDGGLELVAHVLQHAEIHVFARDDLTAVTAFEFGLEGGGEGVQGIGGGAVDDAELDEPVTVKRAEVGIEDGGNSRLLCGGHIRVLPRLGFEFFSDGLPVPPCPGRARLPRR